MAFPSVAAFKFSRQGTDSTTHTVALPDGVVSGDLLKIDFVADGNTSVTWPAGWTEIFESLTASSLAVLAIAYRQADGTEGASITVTTSNSEESAAHAYRIIDHIDPATQAPEVSTGATGTSSTPNPDSLTPTGGIKNYLWFAVEGHDDDVIVATYPTDYTDGRNTVSSGGFGTCTVSSARRQLIAASQDPGVFSLTGTEAWIACTVAIYPDPLKPSLAATIVGDATLNRFADLGRTLAATMAATVVLDPLASLARALAATMVGTAAISTAIGLVQRTLAATVTGSAALGRGLSSFRTLAATVSAMALLSSISAAVNIALGAVAVGNAAIQRQLSFVRTIAAMAAGTVSLSLVKNSFRALTASVAGTAAIAASKNLRFRILAATASVAATVGALYRQFVTPFTGHGGLGILSNPRNWTRRR